MSAPVPRWEVEDRAGGVRVLTLHNERKRNALDNRLLEELASAISLEATRHVRAFIVRSAGAHAFCSGFDLQDLSHFAPGAALPDERLSEVLGELERHPAPSVALVQGGAFGAGCELACACDFRLGASEALFCLPPVRLGIIYAPEGLRRVARTVGLVRARRMLLRAERVPSALAATWGLLDEVHPRGALEAEALRWTADLAAGAPLAIAGTKRSLALLAQERWTDEEKQRLEEDRAAAYRSEDVSEGRAAFLEKRPPHFKGG